VQGNEVLHRGYEDGKRFKEKIKYKPYLFFPSTKETEYKTLDGSYVVKETYDTIKEASDAVKLYKHVTNFQVYGLQTFSSAYVNDIYPTIDYDQSQISILNFDIEVESDEGFPDPNLAEKPVNAITITHRDQTHLFSTYALFQTDDPTIIYHYAEDEIDLLSQFINVWRKIDPDVLTGWYISGFDIPYIINRITKLMGEKAVKMLSPWGKIFSRTFEVYGKEQINWSIAGIATLDYIDLYKKFSFSNHESYTLNFISHHELGEKKLDYTEYSSLIELWRKNPQKYLDYNIRDAKLVDKLEDKLKYIEQVFALAYDAKINYVDTLGTVKMWDTIIHNWLMEKNIVVPIVDVHQQAVDEKRLQSITGGYVKDVDPGRKNWVVSFDLKSLYPHLIMQYNISPETLRGQTDSLNVEDVDNIVNGKLDSYAEFMQKENVTLCPTGCYFDRDIKGFLPALMKKTFKLREEYKTKMLAAKAEYETNPSENLQKKIDRYYGAQMINKIKLNSVYGALANPYFRWYRRDLAESITSAGRLSIKWVSHHVNKLLNDTLKTEGVDYVIAMDTDSMYLDLEPLVNKMYMEPDTSKEDIVEFLDKLSKQWLEPFIEKTFDKLAKYTNAAEQNMFMNRELISDSAIWRAKKHYIMSVYDQEGVRYTKPKIIMKGVEAVKSSTPEVCRDAIKESFKIILGKSEDELINYIKQFLKEFSSMNFEDVAFPSSVNGLTKYANESSIYIKGTPIRVRASLVYNDEIEKKKLTNKYEKIQNGDKIKYCYMQMPNPFFENVIAAHSILPRELEFEDYIDYTKQFNKSYLDPIKSFTEVINWKTEKMATLKGNFA
jgi:DNA polymerase elongation subunit (family B)